MFWNCCWNNFLALHVLNLDEKLVKAKFMRLYVQTRISETHNRQEQMWNLNETAYKHVFFFLWFHTSTDPLAALYLYNMWSTAPLCGKNHAVFLQKPPFKYSTYLMSSKPSFNYKSCFIYITNTFYFQLSVIYIFLSEGLKWTFESYMILKTHGWTSSFGSEYFFLQH